MRRILILLFLFAICLWAQEAEGWLVLFGCGFQPDLARFNEVFAQHGLPVAQERHYGWGIELRSGVGGGFLLAPMFFRTCNDVATDEFFLRTEHTGIMGELGYKLSLFKFLAVVPLVAVGGVQPRYRIQQKTGEVSLDSLLNAPGNTAMLSPGMKLTGLGALELNLLLPTKTGRYGLSLRGGYLYSPFRLDWRTANGARVTGTPASKIQGPWFSVGLTLIPAPEVMPVE
ncbi:MAG: hypothetical protein ACUVUD_04895 [bacterium]